MMYHRSPLIRVPWSLRKAGLIFFCAVFAVGAFGCTDEAASKRNDADRRIAALVAQRQKDAIPFVPKHADMPDATLVQFRQAKRDEHIEDLTQIRSIGTPMQQSAVNALLAGEYAGKAHDLSEAVAMDWSRFESRTVDLIDQVGKLEGAIDHVVLFEPDEAPVLAMLRDQVIEGNNRLADHERAVAQLEKKIAEHTALAEKHAAERVARAAEVAAGRSEIGQAEGTAILDIADRVQRAGADMASADAKYQLEASRIEVLSSELRVVQQQSDLAREVATSLRARVAEVETRSESIARALDEQIVVFRELLVALNSRAEKLAAAFDQDVAEKLRGAAEDMKTAVEMAETARRHATRKERRAAESEVVAMMLGRVHVLVGDVLARRAYGRTLEVVADGVAAALEKGPRINLESEAIRVHENQAKNILDSERELIEEARVAIDEGRKRAVDLAEGPESDPYVQGGADYIVLFDAYAARLKAPVVRPEPRVINPEPVTEAVVEDDPLPEPAAVTLPEPVAVTLPEPAADTPPMPVAVTLPEPAAATSPDVPGGPVTMHGELPPLPDALLTDRTPMLAWVDGRHLTPAAVRETATLLLGAGAGQFDGQIAMFEQFYQDFAEAGGTSVVGAISVGGGEESGDPRLYVSLAPDADEANVSAWIQQVNRDPSLDLQTRRNGDWMVGSPGGAELQVSEGKDIRAAVEEACQAMGPSPLLVTIVPTEDLLAEAEARQDAVPMGADLAELEPMLEQARWFAIAVRLGEAVGIYTTMQLPDRGTAANAAQLAQEKLDQTLSQLAESGGPMAMAGPLLRGTIQITAEEDRLHINVSGPGFRMLAAMAASFMGGGEAGEITTTSPGTDLTK